MNKQITLTAIVDAIGKNCVLDRLAPKPLTLKKYEGGNKNKGVGRLLCIYFADRAGINRQDVMTYLEMDETEYEKRMSKMIDLLEAGRELFIARSDQRDEPALYFYRKLKIIESALYSWV